MSLTRIPEPTKSTSDLIGKLDRALKLFDDARKRREAAKKQADAARFKLGDLQRTAPRAFSDIRSQAQHEAAIENAQLAVKDATKVFIDVNREVAQAAVAVAGLQEQIGHAARLELGPVRCRAEKEVESAVDALLAALDMQCALNRVLGNGAPQVWPQVPCPRTGYDLAYRRERTAPVVPIDWLTYQRLRNPAVDAADELPPAVAAE